MPVHALDFIGTFNATDKALFEKEVKTRHVRKGNFLLREGMIASSLFFNITGAAFEYNASPSGDENITGLYMTNEWFFNPSSLALQKPSHSFIAAYSDSIVLELSIQSIHTLIYKSAAFFQFNSLIAQPTLGAYFFDNTLTPFQKYAYILEHRPALLQVFPLKMIAAYLKITPETLSRVREKLARAN